MIMSQYNFVIEILQHGNKCFNIFEIDKIMHGDIKPKYNSTIVIITILLQKQATTLFKSTYNISLLLVAFNFSDFGYKLSFKVVLARERGKCYNVIICNNKCKGYMDEKLHRNNHVMYKVVSNLLSNVAYIYNGGNFLLLHQTFFYLVLVLIWPHFKWIHFSMVEWAFNIHESLIYQRLSNNTQDKIKVYKSFVLIHLIH